MVSLIKFSHSVRYIVVSHCGFNLHCPNNPDVRNWLIRKDHDPGKDWRQEEKGMTEDEMVGWHHQLDRPEVEQAPGVGDGQGSLACCSPWVCKEWYTEWHDWVTELSWTGEGKNLKSDASKTEVIFYVWRMELKQEKWKQTVANEKS